MKLSKKKWRRGASGRVYHYGCSYSYKVVYEDDEFYTVDPKSGRKLA